MGREREKATDLQKTEDGERLLPTSEKNKRGLRGENVNPKGVGGLNEQEKKLDLA